MWEWLHFTTVSAYSFYSSALVPELSPSSAPFSISQSTAPDPRSMAVAACSGLTPTKTQFAITASLHALILDGMAVVGWSLLGRGLGWGWVWGWGGVGVGVDTGLA